MLHAMHSIHCSKSLSTLPGTCSKSCVNSCLYIEEISKRVFPNAYKIYCRINDQRLDSDTSDNCRNVVYQRLEGLPNVPHLNKLASNQTAYAKRRCPKTEHKQNFSVLACMYALEHMAYELH